MEKNRTQKVFDTTICDTCKHCIRRTIRDWDQPHMKHLERDCGFDRTFLHCDNTETCNRYEKSLSENDQPK